jgi:hypothetical protein
LGRSSSPAQACQALETGSALSGASRLRAVVVVAAVTAALPGQPASYCRGLTVAGTLPESAHACAGEATNPAAEEYQKEAEYALRRVCSFLVTDVHEAEPPVESAAVQVAMLAYFRNLGSSPRDMTAGAIYQLRLACDAVIQLSYMP